MNKILELFDSRGQLVAALICLAFIYAVLAISMIAYFDGLVE